MTASVDQGAPRTFTLQEVGRLPVSSRAKGTYRRGRWVVTDSAEGGKHVGIITELTADGHVLVDYVDGEGFTWVSRVVVPYNQVRQAFIEEIPGPRGPQNKADVARFQRFGYKRGSD